MNKKKISLEISERDKKLILVLLALGILALAYFLGYKKLDEEAKDCKSQYNTLKVRENDLLDKESNIDTYEKNTKILEGQYNSIMSNYAGAVTQTSQIDFLNRVERITDAWIKSVSFSSPSTVYTFGNVPSSNPSGGVAYNQGMQGYKTTLTLAYEAEYEDWKGLIKFLNEYYSKNVIESITMSFSEITGAVSGTMSLGIYSVVGEDTKYTEPEFDVDTGTDNIFMSDYTQKAPSTTDTGDYIFSNYDYFISVNSFTSALDSCTVGRRGDTTNGSVISDDSNGAIDVSFKLKGTEGKYTVQYQVGENRYEEKCEPGSGLELLILSTSRSGEDDDVEIKLSIENTSDIPVNIKVYNDDKDSGRVKFKTTEGNVVLY